MNNKNAKERAKKQKKSIKTQKKISEAGPAINLRSKLKKTTQTEGNQIINDLIALKEIQNQIETNVTRDQKEKSMSSKE